MSTATLPELEDRPQPLGRSRCALRDYRRRGSGEALHKCLFRRGWESPFLKLGVFLETTELGTAQHEVLFRLALPKDRNRIPDVAFTSYERWPKDRPFPFRGNARDVVPDLAVEVVSPGDLVEELLTKIDEYFRAGVRLVWIVHCNLKQVHVYRSIDDSMIRVLTEADDLDGEDVLPGFRVPVASFFPPSIPEEYDDYRTLADSMFHDRHRKDRFAAPARQKRAEDRLRTHSRLRSLRAMHVRVSDLRRNRQRGR